MSSKEHTLYIYGDIIQHDLGEYNFPDDAVPNKFKNELAALGDVDTIHVRINSGGGSVFAAYAIMNMLKSHKARVITYNDGIAASAATIIAMAGDTIVTAIGSVWMIHMPKTVTFGDSEAHKKSIEILETITDTMVDIYHTKTNINKDELREMLNKETWLTGTQALQKGLADEVSDLKVVAYLDSDKATAFFNGLNVGLDKVHNVKALEGIVGVAPLQETTQETMQETTQEIFSKNKEQFFENRSSIIAQRHCDNGAANQEDIMNITDLQTKHQDIYNDVMQLGIQAERARIQAIDSLAMPGLEELVNKAKFETGITAEALAVELIKAQKENGLEYLAQVKNDAQSLDNINPSIPDIGGDNSEEEDAIVAYLKGDIV